MRVNEETEDGSMDYVAAATPGEREAMKEAWLAYGCTHEFPEDIRIAWVAGWLAAADHLAGEGP